MHDYEQWSSCGEPVLSDKCKVGDKVHYYLEYESGHIDDFDFEVTFIGKSDDGIVRIYGGDKGCIAYEHDFERTCRTVKIRNEDLVKAINLLQSNGYVVRRITNIMESDCNKCEEMAKLGECMPCDCCSCCVCLMQ